MTIQTLFKNRFAEASFEPKKNLVHFQYFATTLDMEDEDYKDMMLTYLKALTELYEKKVIKENSLLYFSDLRKMYFMLVPELQEWTDKEFSSNVLKFSKKSAMLLPKDIFASVSTQQTAGEKNSSQILSHFFDQEEDALNWLFA